MTLFTCVPTKVQAAELNYVNPKIFGAVGDGVKDDTNAILSAIKTGVNIHFPEGNYLITKDIKISSNLIMDGKNAALISSGSAKLLIGSNVTEFNISDMVFDGVAIVRTNGADINDINASLKNVSMKNTDIYGIHLVNVGTLIAENCRFSNIGTSNIDITYQGMGMRIDGGKNVTIKDSVFEQCHGSGGLVLKFTKNFNVYRNSFLKNDYRGIILSNDNYRGTGPDYTLLTKGLIEDNLIEDCGVYASHRTGVGCNGIYGRGNFNEVSVLDNEIKNVCENGIEGTFGLVEGNLVDGTGVDQVNHPTPSGSGVNMYGKVYRNNIVRNTHLPAFYVYDNSKLDKTGIKDLIVEGNIVENSDISGSKGYAIYPNASKYSDVKIFSNTTDKPLYINSKAVFSNVSINGKIL